MPRPYNILYLHPADIGTYVEPYGFPVATPNMQRIAERGVTFRKAFCTSPSCSPARAALLTGQWPVQNGMLSLTHQGCVLDDYRRHLVHTLRDAGYTTVLAGHQHVHPRLSQFTADGEELTPGRAIGYDLDLDRDDNHGDQRVRDFLAGDHPTPFFIDCGFMQTHRPFPDPTPQERPERCRPPAHLPDTAATRREMAGFLRAASAVDVKVGYVLQALADSGHLDDTIIVLTTDHGIDFPDMKAHVNDLGLGVMLILAGGPFTGGTVVDGMVSQLDVFPTLCAVLGIEPPAWLEGRSLLPLVTGERDEIHDAVFGECNFHGGARPTRSIRTTRWRYTRKWYDAEPDPAPAPHAVAERLLHEAGCGPGERFRQEELYDLVADPLERDNRADDPACAAIKAELAGRLRQWMERIDDPLCSGHIEPPPHYAPKAGRSLAEREEHLGRLFERPGRYVSNWSGDPYVTRPTPPQPRKPS